MASSYAVYKVQLHLPIQDPDMPSPRYHTFIFVETNAEGPGSGVKHHVTGDIVNGMHYESIKIDDPTTSETFHAKQLIGYAPASKYPIEFEILLQTLPPPSKQKAFNPKSMRTEPVKSLIPLAFYQPGEPRKPLRKCTEWVEQQAIPSLTKYGFLVDKK